MNKNTVAIMAGGTGGHIFPALAVANYFKEQGWQVVWLGGLKGMENQLVPETGYTLCTLNAKPFVGQSKLKKLLFPFTLAKSVGQALAYFSVHKPKLVIGFGGYPAAPGGVAAKLSRIPLVIHEQNAVLGKTNYFLSKLANLNLTAFDRVIENANVVGNPLRSALEKISWQSSGENNFNLLIIGGSLGAKGINELVPKALSCLPYGLKAEKQINVWHQCGKGHLQSTQSEYDKYDHNVSVVEFISDMAKAFSWADLIICRAGASTVSELSSIGLPAIFVPYPYHKDKQQYKNIAKHLELNAALIADQFQTTAQDLSEQLKPLIENKQLLTVMSNNMLALGKPEATKNIYHLASGLVK